MRRAISAHPYVTLYGAGLVGVWLYSLVTATTGPSGRLDLQPIAQALQYLLVIFAAGLAGYRLRIAQQDERPEVQFGFRNIRWAIRHDPAGRSFWTCVWVGIVAMEVNIALFITFELFVSGIRGSAAIGEYLAWIGAGIAAGAVLGMFSAFIPLAAAAVWRPRRAP